ncbi:MAG: alginate lyase family protein [Terracidiphilus sp.]
MSLGILPVLAATALTFFAAELRADPLKSPWDGHPVPLTDAAYSCPDPPPFSKSLDAESYYSDAHHSIIDPVRKAAYEKAAEAPDHLGQWTTQAADAYLRHGSRAGAQCVYTLLSAAAAAKAWSASMPTGQAHYVQKWLLAGTAMAYLKVRDTGVGTPEQDKEILKWFGLLADQVRDYVDDKMKNPNSDAWNNHRYWAGLAVCAAGIARNDTREFHFGMEAFKAGVDEIGPNGVLPRELQRAGMALHYHLYALAPLIMLAELGEANGVDMYAQNHNAIDRLVNLCEQGLLHPEIFERATGVQQNMPDKISGATIGWAVPYVKRHPDPQLSAWIAQAEYTSFWQWGGLPPA